MNIKRSLLIFATMCAAVMDVVDLTIVNVAIPDMQGELSATPEEVTWVLTSYMIATAVCLPLSGLIADIFGRKRFFITCIIGFTVASSIAGVAQGLNQIVIARIVQGAFGAALIPLSQVIITSVYPQHERGKAMLIWLMCIMLGPVLGPTIGGILIEYSNWRWIFYINIPTGLLAVTMLWSLMTETEIIKRRIDWIGLALLAIGLGCLQFTLDRGNTEDWFESALISITSIASISSFALYVYYTLYHVKNPILDFRVFKDRNFCAATFMMGFIGISIFGFMVIQPLMMSLVFNYPAIDIGFSMAPRAITMIICMSIVGKIINKYPIRYFIGLGIFIQILSAYIAASTFNVDIDFTHIILPFAIQGIGLGLFFTPLATLATSTMPKHLLSDSSIIFNLSRIIGGGIGIAIVVTYFSRMTQTFWQGYSNYLNPYNPNLSLYLNAANMQLQDSTTVPILATEIIKQAQMQAINNVFYAYTIFFILMLPLMFALQNVSVQAIPLENLE